MFSQCPESLVMNFKEFSVEFGPIEFIQYDGRTVFNTHYGFPIMVLRGKVRVYSKRTGALLDTLEMQTNLDPRFLNRDNVPFNTIRREIQDALFKSMDTHIPAIEAKLKAERLEFSLPPPEPMPARSRL